MPQTASFRKSGFLQQSPAGFFVLALPIAAAIAMALWLVAAAAYENIRFAHGTEQILGLIAAIREGAARNTAAGTQIGEDIIAVLVKQGQMAGSGAAEPTKFINAWDRAIRTSTVQPSVMRFETDLPPTACRRLALFFGKDARDLALRRIDVREEGSAWRQVYDATTDGDFSGYQSVEAACGNAPGVTLALTLQIR